jgi:hypothetical protein
MWELYTLWVLVPLILATRFEGTQLSMAAFAVIGVGALGCILGGFAAQRWGSAWVATTQLSISGLCCLLAPWLMSAPLGWMLAWLILWGITVAGDNNRFIFVVDKDSIYQFTIDGLEGVPPTAAATNKKLIRVSTGGKICGVADNGATSCADLLQRPVSVGYDNKLVYVVDAGLKKVIRFRLTTDF